MTSRNLYRLTIFAVCLLFFGLLAGLPVQAAPVDDLIITGVIDGPLTGGIPKAIELYVVNDIPNLSIYGLGSANNGGGTDGQEFTFPADPAAAGTFIWVATEVVSFTTFFGFAPSYTDVSAPNINGDDAIELFTNGAVSDVFGDINVDGTGQPWEHLDGWTYRENNTGPDSSTFVLNNWTFSGINALDGASDNATAAVPFPIGTFSYEPPAETAPELLLTELVVTPTDGEFVEIYNPTTEDVDLSNYYLTDATFAPDGTFYYNITTGTNAGGGSFGDFLARFPDGAMIPAGAYQTVAMTGSAAFLTEYGIAPDYELFDDSSADGEQLMREGLSGSINGQGGLTNGGEVAVLFYWDGASDLVTDVDYAVWGDKDEAVDKTGVALDGPDADSDVTAYLDDTAIADQDVLAAGAHASGSSWQRDDLAEGTETTSGGNGVSGEDETSENLSDTWCEAAPTPGAASDCPVVEPPTDWVINELLADPASDLPGDANGDGTRDSTQDEFVELVNNGSTAVDISGWTISDGFSLRHTFPTGTNIPATCSVVVFGGGTPTGAFGGSIVQVASTGALGLNNGGDSVIISDGASTVVDYVYGSEGGNDESLTRDPDITGLDPLVLHSTATGAAGALFSPGTFVDGSAFAGCGAGPAIELIHNIQGTGDISPLVGAQVTIEGIIVGDFQDTFGANGDLNGFFIQEEDTDADADPLTSEGIFVFDGSSAPAVDVSIGDLVQVTGQVSEFNGLTEISSDTVVLISSGNPLPTPVIVSLPLDSSTAPEAWESMYVTFPQPLVINEYFNYDRFGEIVLSSERLFQPTAVHTPGSVEVADLAAANGLDRITLDDGRTASNPDPAIHPNGAEFTLDNRFRGGDTLTNVTGVMHYSFSLYRIQPTQGADYAATNPRGAVPTVGGNIQVASFNVLNYFNTIDDGVNDICGALQDLECRGADNEEERIRQLDKIVSAMADMNSDVLGIIEVENTPGVEAMADIVAGLNAIYGAGTYAYVDTGIIGTDAIKVGLIYRTTTVSVVGDYAVLDTPEFINPNSPDPKNRAALAQTFMDSSTGGVFTVVVNHLKSKGSGCGAGDDDPEQGNCNLTRTLAAQALIDWLATDPTGSGDSDFLIIGDLNAYDKEDPIMLLADAGYVDLLAAFGGEFAYSYVFDGQLGYLDYALASPSLYAEIAGSAAWHINADEPDILDYDTSFKQDAQDALYEPNAYRASDHDPVLVGLNVCDEIAPTATVTVSPDTLWPPNHKYVRVTATIVATDNFDPNPTITLLSVTSNEPDRGFFRGDRPRDIKILDDTRILLRAERWARGNGRIYTITYEITDACGNSTIVSATVTVPLNQGQNP